MRLDCGKGAVLALMSMLAVRPLSQLGPAGFSKKHFGQLSSEIIVYVTAK